MAHNQDKALIAVKKAHSSVEKVKKMLEEDKYCIDIIQQNLAIIGLLRSANQALLEGHIGHCIRDAAKANNQKQLTVMMDELSRVMKIAQTK